jgi:hypothetical protein
MEPIAVTVRAEARWVLIHRCTNCGRLRLNKTAGDDNVLLLMQLAALPLATPFVPFAAEPGPRPAAQNGRRKRGSEHSTERALLAQRSCGTPAEGRDG